MTQTSGRPGQQISTRGARGVRDSFYSLTDEHICLVDDNFHLLLQFYVILSRTLVSVELRGLSQQIYIERCQQR